jgi:hypothetical protein
VQLADECLLLEVTDGSARIPRARHYAPDATTGRGMGLVAALSLAWGTTAAAVGKTVWARVAPDGSTLRGFDLEDLDELADLSGDLGMAGGPLGVSQLPRRAARPAGRISQRDARAS